MRALIFPGQGSQAVGMGKALAEAFPAAREVFAAVDAELGHDLSGLMWGGSTEELNLTANAQPALMAVSVAALRVLEAETGLDVARDVAFVAGHSLGEYSALVAAGCLSVGEAARLLRIRGEAMQKAVPVGQGAMAALLGLDRDVAADVAAEAAAGEVCDVANDNGPGQVVVSGHATAIGRAVTIAQGRGARRAILLPVSAPFHCRLMRPAAGVMEEALASASLSRGTVPVIANVDAAPVREPDEIRDALVRQVTGTVRWRESVARLAADGVLSFIEVGAGKVLTGLGKRIAPDVRSVAFGAPGDLDAVRPLLAS